MAFCKKKFDQPTVPRDPVTDLYCSDFLGQVCWCLPTRQMSMDAWMKQKSRRSGTMDVDMRQR
jgi:hypothetical protein